MKNLTKFRIVIKYFNGIVFGMNLESILRGEYDIYSFIIMGAIAFIFILDLYEKPNQ